MDIQSTSNNASGYFVPIHDIHDSYKEALESIRRTSTRWVETKMTLTEEQNRIFEENLREDHDLMVELSGTGGEKTRDEIKENFLNSEQFEQIASWHDPDEDRIEEFIEELHNMHDAKTLVLSERLAEMKFKIRCDSWVADIKKIDQDDISTLISHVAKFQRFLTAERASHIHYKYPEKDVEKYDAEYYFND